MMLTITHSDEETIAIPTWLMDQLGLREGETIMVSASRHLLHLVPQAPERTERRPSGNQIERDVADQATLFSEPSLEELIAQIRALPPNPHTIHPATKPVSEYVAELADRPPVDERLTFAEWQQLWPQIEAEIDALELAHEIEEGLASVNGRLSD